MAKKKKLPKAEYGQQMSDAGSNSFKAKGFNSSTIAAQLAAQFQAEQAVKAATKAAIEKAHAYYLQNQQRESAANSESTNANSSTTSTDGSTTQSQRKGGPVKTKKKK